MKTEYPFDTIESLRDERDELKLEVESSRDSLKQEVEEKWLFTEKQMLGIRAATLKTHEVKAVVDALKKALQHYVSDGRRGEGWYAEAQDALMKLGKLVEK